ncbi:MAG: endo alpha-1,4 polygalactosaminidase [Pseudomonadota bacterium]
MKIKSLIFLILLIVFPMNSFAQTDLSQVKSWLCFYEEKFPEENIPKYDLYVFDSYNYPPIAPLQEQGSIVVGYVSLGEVAKHDYFFNQINSKNLLIDENENWPGSFRVKVGSRKWHSFVIKELIPSILAKGFNGIFIDTIDTADYIENVKNVKGSIKGAKSLLKKIRKKFPKITILLNNGLFFLSDVGKYIDGVVVEDVFTSYDFEKKKYTLPSMEWTAERLIPLKAFQEKFHKPVFTLGYLEPSQKTLIKELSKRAEEQGFIPYFSDIHLTTIFFHP